MRPERPRPRRSAPGPMEAPPWDPLRNDSLPPTLTPAVPPYVKLGLTVVYTVFYSLLFVFIYVQLWLVLRYRHKRLSYQSVFLFLCLLWASLRTVLFSFYFKDFVAANALSPFVFWLLYCFPVCLQFFTLTLMNLYFTQVIFKAKSKYSPELLKYRFPLYLASLLISLIFLLVNLTCAVLVKTGHWERKVIVSVRVAINDTLFVLCAVSLSVCLYKISKMSLANIYLESKTWPEANGSYLKALPGHVPGLLRVSSDCRRRHRHPALRLPRLLQPVHPVVLPEQERALLRLRLVQCVRPGGPAEPAGRRRLRGVRSGPVRVGALTYHLSGLLLPS
ncbi:integral membrane protein GPR137B isoform X3 [Camelus bactrianus]|uniref:Integral membrane protein GPR137B isoform X3 n=1 Tax=Camelus bactrianus TaxID=9837 RepID=A0AC58R4A4_CAMBA